MNTKIFAVAAAALAITASAASAQVAYTDRQAGAAPFDQGGVFDHTQNTAQSTRSHVSYDRMTTASVDEPRTIRSVVESRTGVPSDTRNEKGLGLFDRVSK